MRPHGYILTAFLVVLVSVALKLTKKDDIPFINPPTWFHPRPLARMDFLKTGMQVFDKARSSVADKPYRVLSDDGDLTVLPSRFAHCIRNENDLDFGEFIKAILQNVARKQLTKYLKWRQLPAKDAILDLVARLSSRVFLGDELCRNDDWLRITKEYTVMSFKAAITLKFVPRPLRPLLHWFVPDCKLVRQYVAQASALISPVIEKRRAAARKAADEGAEMPEYNDAIEWAETECKGQAYDAAIFQLTLSFAAIHTTTDLLAQTMLFLASEPELITPLREEIVQVLKAEGWRKTALYNMKLVDSAFKETQRMKPNSICRGLTDQMRRMATKDVTLDEGITIRRGELIVVDASRMKDPKIHKDVDRYDINRFRSMREDPGKTHKAQLYDWKLAPGNTTDPFIVGVNRQINPKTVIMFRRRKEELDIDSLDFAGEAGEPGAA
ncbi:hypothetical protein SLS63_003789 [Diaporthe eres]|uniref:Ent-kaurene oxidase n=1 Tax=Diaporthe eres TaxID=83184 RepID=A0ABR1PG14_DIAER